MMLQWASELIAALPPPPLERLCNSLGDSDSENGMSDVGSDEEPSKPPSRTPKFSDDFMGGWGHAKGDALS